MRVKRQHKAQTPVSCDTGVCLSVMVGRRIYSVKVVSLTQERLTAADVLKFFESFAIEE